MNKVRLGDIVEINSKTFQINDFDEILYIDTSSVTRGVFDDFVRLSKDDKIPSRARRAVRDKTILYSTVRPNLQHFGILENPKENIVVSTGFVTIDVKNNLVDPKYLYYNLTQDNYTNALHTIATNNVSSYPSINPSDLENLEIEILKDIKTQTTIARVLSSLDEKIELNNKINKELETIAKTIYEYWFVQNANKKWKNKKLVDLGELKNGVNYEKANVNGDKIKVVNVRDISASSMFIDVKDLDDIILSKKKIEKYLLSEDDIIIARSGVPGETRLIEKTAENIIFCGFAIRFRLNDKMLKSYLYFTLKQNEKITKKKSGGSIMPNISQDSLKDILITIPPTLILQKFNKIVMPIFSNIIKNQKENAYLAELRDFLLPLLMNGQVKVNIKK
jgi:type I restriction enzyme S subunit